MNKGDYIMDKFIKNIIHEAPIKLTNEVSYQPGQIVSKTLAQNKHHSLTLFAFDKNEEISTHSSDGDAMIIALDGKGKITINKKEYILNQGESIIMPAKIPHAVFAMEKFKMLFIVIFPEDADKAGEQ